MGFNARAIIIRGMDYRETDRIIRLIIEDHGKASAMARGVRKAQSKLRGAVEPVTFGTYHLNPGRNMYTISQADTIQTFPRIKESLDKLMAATFLCELFDSFLEEGNPDNDAYELLLGILNVIEKNEIDLEKIVLFTEVRLHAINGIFPDLYQCVQCGSRKTGQKVKIDLNQGGALCSECSAEKYGQESYPLRALFILDKASNESLSNFIEEEFERNHLKDARRIMQLFTSHYLGKELKSRSMLESTLRQKNGKA